MTTSVTVTHVFEADRRLPNLGGKCEFLHGQPWKVDGAVAAPAAPAAIVTEFGKLKQVLWTWIDRHVDHGVMLGPADPWLTS